jgi:hypothetical protein
MSNMHFTVTGEFITSMSREKLVTIGIAAAIDFLTECVIGLPADTAILILTGKSKLTGDSDEGLSLSDDDATESAGVPLDVMSAWDRASDKYIDITSKMMHLRRRIMTLALVDNPDCRHYRMNGVDYHGLWLSFDADMASYSALESALSDLTKELSRLFPITGRSMSDMPLEKISMDVDHSLHIAGGETPSSLSFEQVRSLSKDELCGLFCDSMYSTGYSEIKLRGEGIDRGELLNEYLAAQHEIDKLAKEDIKPNDITDLNDAGWLSPEGKWYGVNGTIANMLHNQIADMLLKSGLVPEHAENNPDNWLMQNGWVRVAHNWVLYEGYDRIGRILPITSRQVEELHRYAGAMAVSNGKAYIQCGVDHHIVTYAMIEMISEEKWEEMFS